jgi:hypothetical protein
MRDPVGFMEPGKKHSQIHVDAPGFCPLCLERYMSGREGGAQTPLVEELVDGVKTGRWICPDGGRSYARQFIEDTGDTYGAGSWPIVPVP